MLIPKTPASGTVQSGYPGDPSLETVKDILQFNAHIIGFDKFDMPFHKQANPDTKHICLVICCVSRVVASMFMTMFDMPLHQT